MKTWFITGTSRGFGREWTKAALDRGDRVAAARFSRVKRGDPVATSAAIFKVVDAENPPLRLILGESATKLVQEVYAERLKTWSEWEDVARAADGE